MTEDVNPSHRMYIDYPYSEALGRLENVPNESHPYVHDCSPPLWREWLPMLLLAGSLGAALWVLIWCGLRIASAWLAPWV